MTQGKLIVITGPSGVGKGTLVKELLNLHPELNVSISATTRSPRPGEVHGVHYYFLSPAEFETMIASNSFLEWAQYTGNYYGTPRAQVETQLQEGKSIILEIELLGARQVKSNFPDTLGIFILPPTFAELERRLQGRGNDSPTAIQQRLERAQEELQAADEFDYQIVNDDFKQALKLLETAIFS